MNARGEYGSSRRTWAGADPSPPLPPSSDRPSKVRGALETGAAALWIAGGLIFATAGLNYISNRVSKP